MTPYLLVTRNPGLIAFLLQLHPEIAVGAGETCVAPLRDRGGPITEDGVLSDAERSEAVYLATDLDDAGVWARVQAVRARFLVFPFADDDIHAWLRRWLAQPSAAGPELDRSSSQSLWAAGLDPTEMPGYNEGPSR